MIHLKRWSRITYRVLSFSAFPSSVILISLEAGLLGNSLKLKLGFVHYVEAGFMFKFVCGGGEIRWKYLASQITQSFPLSDGYTLHAASAVF